MQTKIPMFFAFAKNIGILKQLDKCVFMVYN